MAAKIKVQEAPETEKDFEVLLLLFYDAVQSFFHLHFFGVANLHLQQHFTSSSDG